MALRHFLTLMDASPAELRGLIERAIALKKMRNANTLYEPLKNKVLGMVFEKSSTRTRVSFETAMTQFGGSSIFLSPRDTQLGRGEPVEDTARILSSMVDVIMIRTYAHDIIERFAAHSRVPVINALTDQWHPCQLLADMQTWTEKRGDIAGRTVAWIGDGNNMCNTYISAARQFDFHLRIACPKGYEPDKEILKSGGARITLVNDASSAAKNANLIVTDTWTSMGWEEEQEKRLRDFATYQVNAEVMAYARSDALFMHCLPAHRGEEVSAEVIDGAQSVVWDEAENRLHAQKALLELLLVKQ